MSYGISKWEARWMFCMVMSGVSKGSVVAILWMVMATVYLVIDMRTAAK